MQRAAFPALKRTRPPKEAGAASQSFSPNDKAASSGRGALQNIAGNAVHGPALDRRLWKEVALSVNGAAGDGIEFIVRKQLDFTFHIYFLLDEADSPHRRTGN